MASITINIPPEHETTVLNGLRNLTDNFIILEALNTQKRYRVAAQGGTEGDWRFVKRFINKTMWRMVRLEEKKRNKDDYRTDVDAVTHKPETIPEGIFT